jgi:hypothetical protein
MSMPVTARPHKLRDASPAGLVTAAPPVPAADLEPGHAQEDMHKGVPRC